MTDINEPYSYNIQSVRHFASAYDVEYEFIENEEGKFLIGKTRT